MKTNFLGGAYKLDSLPVAAQTCINLYPERNESGQGEIGALRHTPGHRRLLNLPISGCRGMFQAAGAAWAVYGNTLFRINGESSYLSVGEITSNEGTVRMAANPYSLVVAHSGGWHTVQFDSLAFSYVENSPTMSDVSFIDNYLVGANADGAYQWANVGTTVIDPLSFASAEGSPDSVVRTIADHRELWLFGTDSIEVAVVTSDPNLPFTRTSYIEQGILAVNSVSKIDNSVFWLGRSSYGTGVVYMAQGYTPVRISTHAIEQAIAKYSDPNSAIAFTYQQGGHHFYVLSFVEATWVYDINAQEWHQRGYRDPITGEIGPVRGQYHAMLGYTHLVGDYLDGRVYALDLNQHTDDGSPIYRERVFIGTDAEFRRVQYLRGELIAETGIGLDGAQPFDYGDPQVWLSWSDDGGRTWSDEQSRTLGKIGQYLKQVVWRRMGMGRKRYFRLRSSAAVPVSWMGFNIDARTMTK